MIVPVTPQGFWFSFASGDKPAGARGLRIQVLDGADHETLFGGFEASGHERGFELFVSADWLVGVRRETTFADLAAQTAALYADLIAVSQAHGRELTRIWNYVPDINGTPAGGLETYQAFCLGRAKAFDGANWSGPLPAASAVGGEPGVLAVMFAAAREKPRASENPEQVPAYEYPADYGPRAPSFSRAMRVEADGKRWTFISGTAAIKGHLSRAAGDLSGQIECTLDNLRIISVACGLGEQLAAGRDCERHFKVYLRQAGHLAEAKAVLGESLFREGDRVAWVRADICRAELLIEIEATVLEA